MARNLTVVLAAATLLALTAATQAQSERSAKLLGTWTRKADGCKVKLEVKPETLRCTVATEEGYAVTVVADYVVSKDGVLLGILHAGKAGKSGDEDALSKRLFYFQFRADDKALVIQDLNYEGDDKTKEVLEGRYHRAEGKPAAKADGKPALTLPSGHYLQHPPLYCPPPAPANPRQTEEGDHTSEAVRRASEWLKRFWDSDGPPHLTSEGSPAGIQENGLGDWRFFLGFFLPAPPSQFHINF
jgi:hypothetical protein